MSALIRIQGLSYRYPNASSPALDNVSFDISAGRTFGLLGPNGAGKTTLLSLLTGLRTPREGRIEIAGHDLAREAHEIKRLSALVPQEYAFYLPLTGLENLQFFADVYDVAGAEKQRRIAHAIEVCRLEEVLRQRAEEYSGGLKRRLNLAIGLLNAPRLLYLDEPTVGVDARSRQTILAALQTLKAAGITIVYTSHYMEEVQAICDDLGIIDHGRVVARDSMQTFLARAASPQLRVQLAVPLAQPMTETLSKWHPAVDERNGWTFDTQGAQDVEAILAQLREQGAVITQVQYGVSRLEQIYLSLLETAGPQ